VFFAYHIFVLDEIENTLQLTETKNVNYIRIDGKTLIDKRNELIHTFNNNENCLYAILSLSTCYQGISLSSCSNVIFCEMLYHPSKMIEAEDRCHRIGQHAKFVNIHYLYGEDTFDQHMYKQFQNYVKNENIEHKGSDNKILKGGIGKLNLESDSKTKSKMNKGKIESYFNIKDVILHETNCKRSMNSTDTKTFSIFDLTDEEIEKIIMENEYASGNNNEHKPKDKISLIQIS
jgi:hypothetical protein